MQPVGIIANPSSGKDIRRLVAYGSVFDNHEKVNIVRRVLLGLDALGVHEAFFMPDTFGIGARALKDLDIECKVSFLDMEMNGVQEDSTHAASMLNAMNAACIVTLGGDGTNRAVARAEGTCPLLPISTGTNNVFPTMMESTLAGLAAGIVAVRPDLAADCITTRPRLEVWRDEELLEPALVDVVVSKPGFVASRAIWEIPDLREIFLAHAQPGNIGFSAVGGHIKGLNLSSNQGLHLVIGEGKIRIMAPIGPGLVRWAPIKSYRVFNPGEHIPVTHTPALLALDGEREVAIKSGEKVFVVFNPEGPRVVEVTAAIKRGAEEGLFEEPIA